MPRRNFVAVAIAWARDLRRDVVALWLGARDPRVPVAAKLLCALVAGYALSPIDLVPDFIPILGYLDDLLLLPLGIWLAVRMIPAPVMADLRLQANELSKRPVNRIAAVLIILVWLVAAALACWALWPRLSS